MNQLLKLCYNFIINFIIKMSLLGYTTLSSNTLTSRLVLCTQNKMGDKEQYYFDLDYYHYYLEDYLNESDIVFILNRHFSEWNLNYHAKLSYSLQLSYFYIPQWKTQIHVYKNN